MLCLLTPLVVGVAAAGGDSKGKSPSRETWIRLTDSQQRLMGGYVERLRAHPVFDATEAAVDLPPWIYASPDDPSLAKVREEHQLKAIAGEGTEKSRLVRLLEWAHQVTVGRGDIGKPDLLNTLAIIDFVRTTGRAVDCRGKAIVLNEGLVALGYHSRRISFQPDVFDGDSHSIVTVFSRAQGKWVCLDPTFNTYFHDDEGMPLGFLEIREAYRSGRVPRFRSIALPIRGELKMAGHPFDRYDSWYAVYMAKNCFRAYCPQQSAFGYESSTAPSWIALLPVGYRPDETGRAGTTYTTSARVFFRSPGS